jgi:hypothetical protein
MALDGTYTGLLASVASWMNRTDLTATIPDFVSIAESRIARELRLRKQITYATITASVSTRSAALPTDWLELENISVSGSPDSPLQYVTIEHMDVKYPEGGGSGKPFVYTVEGDNVILGPTPDSAYNIDIIYYARFPSAITTGTNWLLTNHPNIYLYACLREGAFFTKDAPGAVQWDGLFKQEVKTLQDQDDEATHSGSALRVKTV